MICKKCGKEAPDGKFCNACGELQEDIQNQNQAQQQNKQMVEAVPNENTIDNEQEEAQLNENIL